MVDGVLRSDGDDSPAFGSIPAPWGFAARYSPRSLVGYWLDVVALTSGRTGVLLGCCAASATTDQLRSDARETLLETADPVRSLRGMAGPPWSVMCAVIDRDTIGYSGYGRPAGAVAAPGVAPAMLDCADGRLGVETLQPAATVLLCTGPIGSTAALLNDCDRMHPDQLADRVILGLNSAPRGDAGSAAVLYRHPPEPLSITLPADPASLSVSRGRLREWLNSSGLDSELCADILLAVGEATANATEHAVLGAPDRVEISLDACFEPGAVKLSVVDNGRWKPASASSGHRGHGLHLMNALMDTVDLKTSPQGTSVVLVKELTR